MNRYLVVFATIVVAVSARAGRQGWPAPTTAAPTAAPTTGWPAPPPPPPTEAPGWPAPPPTAAPGWPAPAPAPGWAPPPPASISVAAEGELAAIGSGWAASSQDIELLAQSENPDGEDPSQVSQLGVISQATLINPDSALGAQNVDVEQIAIGQQAANLYAIGDLAQASLSGWAGASGDASSSGTGHLAVNVNKP